MVSSHSSHKFNFCAPIRLKEKWQGQSCHSNHSLEIALAVKWTVVHVHHEVTYADKASVIRVKKSQKYSRPSWMWSLPWLQMFSETRIKSHGCFPRRPYRLSHWLKVTLDSRVSTDCQGPGGTLLKKVRHSWMRKWIKSVLWSIERYLMLSGILTCKVRDRTELSGGLASR